MDKFAYHKFQHETASNCRVRENDSTKAQVAPKGSDPVEAPRHYQGAGMQVWDVLKAFLSAEELIGYCRGNVIKYHLRYQQKGGLQDLRKADWYADKLKKLVAEQQ